LLSANLSVKTPVSFVFTIAQVCADLMPRQGTHTVSNVAQFNPLTLVRYKQVAAMQSK
jgi:hypothetical protein